MILFSYVKYIQLLPIFLYCISFIRILPTSLHMVIKLFFSNRMIHILYNLNKYTFVYSTKYVENFFEVVCFHLLALIAYIACMARKCWLKYLRICISKTVCWALKLEAKIQMSQKQDKILVVSRVRLKDDFLQLIQENTYRFRSNWINWNIEIWVVSKFCF